MTPGPFTVLTTAELQRLQALRPALAGAIALLKKCRDGSPIERMELLDALARYGRALAACRR